MRASTAIILVGAVGIGVFLFMKKSGPSYGGSAPVIQNPKRNDLADILAGAGTFASGIGDLVESWSSEGEKQPPSDAGYAYTDAEFAKAIG